ncbi:MAG: hypothetical protein AABM40_04700 [Chloroflexota bacterium]
MLHSSFAVELVERRQRAGVYVALTTAIFGAVIAAGLSADVARALRGNIVEGGAYVALLVYAMVSLATALFGLNVGLPWERRGMVESLVWWLGQRLGPSLSGPYADLLDETYEHGPLSYRELRRFATQKPKSASASSARSPRLHRATWPC